MTKLIGVVLALAACGKSSDKPETVVATIASSSSATNVTNSPEPDTTAPASETMAAAAPDASAEEETVGVVEPDAAPTPVPDVAPVVIAPVPQPTIAPEVGAKIPAEGIMIASKTFHDSSGGPDVFVIWKLTPGGLVELFRESGTSIHELAWIDAHTLVVTDIGEADDTKVRRFRDGQPDGPLVVVTLADWKGARTREFVGIPELMLGPKGAVWLHECNEESEVSDQPSTCIKRALIRVDTTPFEVVTKLPKGVSADRVARIADDPTSLASLTKVAAPPGYSAKVVSVTIEEVKWRAVECVAPNAAPTILPAADLTDTSFGMKPDKLAWIRAQPPLLAVEGKAVNPIGWVSRPTKIFRACVPTPLAGYRSLGASVWAEHVEPPDVGTENVWRLFVDDTLVGVIPAASDYFAVAPPAGP